ncbi:receptor-like protein 12 [Herrania umbratica]|uniref:Receptor-like protein 12 n=1 Tax=Herrania umbratica TaxID=108875 RepID=A0A6J1ANC5_9ROSI|nr:receptor-like protein 12 [Herrania umbratica]
METIERRLPRAAGTNCEGTDLVAAGENIGRLIRMLCQILCLLLALLHFHVGCSLSSPSSFLHSAHLCLPEQKAALLEFKNTISLDHCWKSASYPKTNSWNESFDCCSWDGVSCHKVTGHVIGIDLSQSCLNGTLHANSSLFHLRGLQRLNLAYNNFNGSISSELINQLVSLTHLNLSSNLFSDLIPCEISLLSKLVSLDLSYNGYPDLRFDSQGFVMLARNLTELRNLIIDSVDMPDVASLSFLNLTSSLEHLSLRDCQLHGEFPSDVFRLPYDGPLPNHVNGLQLLEAVWLSNNLISGGVPSWLFTLPSLQELDLTYNKLTGPIEQIQKPNSVWKVDLSFNDIHGPIPSSFFGLVDLETLRLSSNNLSGVIKSNLLAKLKKLGVLDLSNNSLLSLSTSGNDVNYSFPYLVTVSFSSCSIRQFPSFFRTSKMSYFDLFNNKIPGGISKWEAEGWEELVYLNLSYNFLTTFEQFPGKNLLILDLQSNLLQGPILSTCLNLQNPNPPQDMRVFLISKNNLTGNIPPLICNWSWLEHLDLSRNRLSGIIPNCLGNFSQALELMNLEMNNFYGKIPNSFAHDLLRNLLLNDNQLEGLLPRTLANCSSLELLNLRNNKLTDTFPHWLASLPWLRVLILRSNRLHGPMPNSIASSNFSLLQIIDLSHNELTGPLPTKFFQNLRAMKDHVSEDKRHSTELPRSRDGKLHGHDYYYPVNVTTKRFEIELVKTLIIFTFMDFSNNLFCGEIPEELGELILLQGLNFSNNNLTGPIPPSFGNMVWLESLDLSSNKLSGRIPSQLTNLTFLEVLNLSQNDLVGPIPHGKQFDTFENDSYSGNLGLCGLPLSKQCEPKPPMPMLKEDEGSETAFIWKVAMMGYGCGVVLGLSMGYIVFTTGRPWWFVRIIERDWQNNVTKWIRSI